MVQIWFLLCFDSGL